MAQNNDASSLDLRRRLRLDIAYDGTMYHGWQAQDGLPCVQTTLEKRLHLIFGECSRLQGSSRTDSGVHALHTVAHVDVLNHIKISPERLKKALNRMLPLDIRILNVQEADGDFHARFSTIGKCYCYVFNKAEMPSVFANKYCCYEPKIKHIDAMRDALKMIEGKHDFVALYCQGSTVPQSTQRTMYISSVEEVGDYVLCTICGDGFLYKMVRSIMGVVRDIGTGKYEPHMMQTLLNATKRTRLAQTAPASGLYLCKVYYQMPVAWENEIIQSLPFSF